MKIKRLLVFFIVIIVLIDLAYFYPKLTGKATAVHEKISVNLTRVIDGDTIDTELGKVRLLGINTPEKKQPYYGEAKDFLKKYENKTIELESHGKDKYNRTLGYVYFNNEMINSQILESGLANLYVYNKDKYFNDLERAEQYARENELGIWDKSQNYGCLKIVDFKYIEQERCKNQEQLVLNNECINLSIILKDDANHIEKLEIPVGISSYNFSCVFNDAGDSLFIRDEKGLLLFYRY